MLGKPSLVLTPARLDAIRDTAGTAGHLTLTLPPAVTQALLTRVASLFHGGIDDVLLTGLAVAVADWCRRHGRGRAADAGRLRLPARLPTLVQPMVQSLAPLMALLLAAAMRCCSIWRAMGREEAFGREEAAGVAAAPGGAAVSADIDLTRTVGWFTSLYPVRLDPGPIDLEEALSGGPALGRALKTVKEQLRAVPGKGLGYGLLRYLNGETAAELAGLPMPQLGFNYLGRFAAGGAGADWAPAPLDGRGADAGDGQLSSGDPAMPLSHVIEINALTLDGTEGPALSAHWTFAPALLGAAAVEDLAATWFRALTALVRHAAQPGAGGLSPSDLALVDLTQDEIERLEGDYGPIEEILPLSPLQEGLLFHALYDAAGTGCLYGAA